MPADSQSDRLDSWKSIANYLGRSVRTARRWEAEEGLPVHRQMHKSQGSVYAYRSEIDAWRRAMERKGSDVPRDPTTGDAPAAPEKPSRSVAVLPFAYLGPDPDSAYIADGFTEEIITGLSRLRPLRVICWTSSMTLRNSGKSAREIGRALQVGRLVEGTVRHEGDRLRVAARLVDAETDDRVWSHDYDGRLGDLFSIQERIAQAVVEALDVRRSAEPGSRITDRPMGDVAAWQCLVQARQAALRWRKDSIDEAVSLLRHGLSVAGDDARLYAALGRTHLYYREAGIDTGEAPVEEAESCARRASELRPGLAAVRQLEGWIRYARGDVQAAVDALKEALAEEPADPDTLALLANCYLVSGQGASARPLIETLVSIDPLTPLTRCMPGWARALEGDFASAVEPYRDMFTMDPDNPMARLFYVYMLAAAGRRDQAREVAEAMPEALGASPPGRITDLFARALSGRRVDPLSREESEALSRGTDVFPRFLAQAYALAGDASQAIAWISVAIDRGFVHYPFLSRHDPFLAPLAGNPAYDAVLERARTRWEAFRP